MEGIFLHILNAISAQGEQGKIKQERQICALYRGEGSISDDQNSRGHRGCCGEEKHMLEARYTQWAGSKVRSRDNQYPLEKSDHLGKNNKQNENKSLISQFKGKPGSLSE